MKRLGRWFWLAGLVFVIVMVAVACGEDEEGPAEGETPGATEPSETQEPTGELKTDFGVTDTEIKLGMTLAQSGNPSASGYAAIATAVQAYFAKVNQEDEGVCDRQINVTLADDQYDPALALELATRLAVQDQVVAFVGNLGTPAVTGQVDYINDPNADGDTSDGIPHLYLSTGASKWDNPEQWPWTIGYIPDYVFEGSVLGRVVNENFPGQSAAILYQNDDFGQDGRQGFTSVFEGEVIAEQSYEATAAEIDSQMANLRATNPDILLLYTLPLITADAVRYMQANDWHPQVVWGYINPNTLLGALLGGAGGPEAGYQQIAGNISTNYILDTVGDADNPAMVEHVRIMGQYGGPDPVSQLSVYGQSLAELMVETLDIACQNGDMTRAGVLEAAESIQGYTSDLYLPGIEVNLSDTDHFAIQDLQPVRFRADGTLETLGELVNAEDVVAEGDSTPE